MNELIREIIYSEEYEEYYAQLDAKTQTKFNYLEQMIKTQYVVNKKYKGEIEQARKILMKYISEEV